jgi:pimeloyl-ACP methyl ester carboxylesterase/tetratricopeptide (TPR) repeat protein
VPIAPELTGLGTLHMSVTTSVPQAQRYFDQGLRLLYAFNHAEAIRAFREAARLDPGLAMAHWGRALALGPNLNAPMTPENGRQAYAAIRQAVKLAGHATPRERALIDALAMRYAPDGKGDRAALDRAYAGAMQKAADRFDDDPDVQTFFADAQMNTMPWDYWQKDGTAKPETVRILAVLERVIARQPDHAGALHYHIHLLEASADPDRAEASADRLGSLMPAAGHMVHMPAHIYLRVGRYADAAEANVRAIAADEDYLAQCQAQGLYPVSYYPHNLHFLWAAATLEGRRAVAVEAARKVAEKVPHHHAGAVAWTADFPVTPMLAYVRFGLWQEMLTEPKPPVNQPYATGIWHYGRGLGFVARQRLDAAATELTALRVVMKHQAFATTLKDLPLLTNLQIASRILDGELSLQRGNADAAVTALREAVKIEDGIPYNEPPVWHHPTRQILGAILLETGRPADAEAIYREDLKRFRENGWSLFGLAKSLEAQQRSSEALEAQRQFEKAWTRADIQLTSSRIMSAGDVPVRPKPAATSSAQSDSHAHHSKSATSQQSVELPDGTRLMYVEQGDADGTPVVLLHGYTDSWRSFERVLPYMPNSLRVFAVTQRGHGDSDKPEGSYGSDVFARDIAALMDALSLERAVIVGHSMGSTVAMRFAIEHPKRTQALVLVGAFMPRPANPEVRKFFNEVAALKDPVDSGFARDFQLSTLAQPVPPEFFETVVGESMKVPARVWNAALKPYLTMDFSAELTKIRVPTLLLWGDRDAFTGRGEQDALTAAINGSRLVVYAGAGHSPHWEEPQRVAGQLASFVTGVTPASATLHTGPVPPLTMAVWNQQAEDVRRMLQEGADPNQAFGKPVLTAWQVAVMVNHQPSLDLFARYSGARPKSHYTTTLFKTALQRGDVQLVAEFIRAGVSLWFGDAEYSPLGIAAANGYIDVMRLLLDGGAEIDYQDRFGDTALMAAARSGSIEAVRLLLSRGAKPSITDGEGMTAITWAERMGRRSIIEALLPESSATRPHGHAHKRSSDISIRTAASRGLAVLEKGGTDWLKRQRCASCHHQGLLVPVASVARRQGFIVDETGARAQEVRLRSMLAAYEPAMQAAHENDEALVRFSLGFFGQMTSGSAWLLAGLLSAESARQPLEKVAAAAAGATQLSDGRWRVGTPRIPIQDSDMQTTALMIRTLTLAAAERTDTPQRIARARSWLMSAPATTATDKAYRLLGLLWSDADRTHVHEAALALLTAQEETGGWAQLPGLNPDAYATGLALVALREAEGFTRAHTAHQRGVAFLLRTQQNDGSWFVHKRAASFNPYFESGFPYGKHQFSSFAGTAWATMALMYASEREEVTRR